MALDSQSLREAASAIAVVLSLEFVGWEIRQNTAAQRAQTQQGLVDSYQQRANLDEEWEQWIADSDHVLPAMLRLGEVPFDSLSVEDQERLRITVRGAMYRLDGLYYRYELGLMDEAYYSTVFQRMLAIWVPRWREFGILEDGLLEVRPSFRSEIARYRDAPLVILDR